MQKMITGPLFKGFKMIPPGAHILHYNSVSKENELSSTISQFLHIKPQQVVNPLTAFQVIFKQRRAIHAKEHQ